MTDQVLRTAAGSSKILAIIPAYNEERFIGSVVLKVRQHAHSVLVVDDGSTDGTAEIAEAAGAIVVRHAENKGKGAALNSGFRRARQLEPEVVVLLDGDGQHLPEEIPVVIAPVLRGEADIVIGSRYLQKHSQVPTHRVWGHRVFNRLTNLISGTHTTDSQSGYRAFSARALQLISFDSDKFSVESEMQFLAHEHNLRLAEVSVTIRYLDKPKRSVISHGLVVLNGILRLVSQHRPLFFFSVPGSLMLLAGLAWGAWVVVLFNVRRELAVGYALISVLLSIVGTLALFTGIILHSVRALLLELVRRRNE